MTFHMIELIQTGDFSHFTSPNKISPVRNTSSASIYANLVGRKERKYWRFFGVPPEKKNLKFFF